MYIKIFHSVYTAVLAYELRHLRAATHIGYAWLAYGSYDNEATLWSRGYLLILCRR